MSPPLDDSEAKLAKAQQCALRLLRVRDRSRQELAGALERRGFPEAVRARVLDRLAELGYLDDRRFARARARALLASQVGPKAVEVRLRGHGISPEEARAAVADAALELGFDELESARALLARRRLEGALPARARARAARLLASHGFSEEIVERLLGAALETPPEDG